MRNTRVVVTVLAVAASVLLAAPPAQARTEAKPASATAWPTSRETNKAGPASWSPPRLPTRLPGFTAYRSVTTEERLFQGDGWTVPYEYPTPLMNGCNNYRWTLRWHSRNPDVRVAANWGLNDAGDPSPLGRTVYGGSGQIMADGCTAPMFKFNRALHGNGSNLVDVAIQFKLWHRNDVW